MKQETITCINCPVGCRLSVTVEQDEVISVQGNACPRGISYARQECVAPMRTITASVPVSNRDVPVSVKTSAPVPKASMQLCMDAILNAEIYAPVQMGQVLIKDVCGTGVDVVATRCLL